MISRLSYWLFLPVAFSLAALSLTACSFEREPQDAGVTFDARTQPAQPDIVVATWNVNRLFDTVCDTGHCGFGAYEEQPNQLEFSERAAQIAGAIESLDADIVLLEEIESQAALDAVQAAMRIPYPTAIMGETGRPASVDVALLARAPAFSVVRHRDTELLRPGGGSTTFAREFLEVHLDFDGAQVIAFVAHFKSKFNDDATRRLAEATAAHSIVAGVARDWPSALVVMGGDLNDTPGSPPLIALERDGDLFRVASELGSAAQTITFQGQGQAIDHLFIATGASGAYVSGTARVFGQQIGFGGSDHASLRAGFLLP